MKNTLFHALIILATLPASAQKAGSPNWSASGALAQDYTARVDGLLREVHASLQNISEAVEAGRLTPEQGQKSKLAATRDMISRLDAIAAIYDAHLRSKDNVGAGAKTESGAVNASATDKAVHAKLHTSNTVSVEELRREEAAAVVTAHSEDVPR